MIMKRFNKTFPLETPTEVTCLRSHEWKSPHVDKFVVVKDKKYKLVSEMPGYGLIGVVCEAGTIHYLPNTDFAPLHAFEN